MNQHSFPNVIIVNHPLIQHRLTLLRNQETPHHLFRQYLEEISAMLFYEASRHLELMELSVTTPLEKTTGFKLAAEIALVPILRAGLGMVNGISKIFPEARVGMIGMYRDENTLTPVDYYLRLPRNLPEIEVFLLDPMLATGGSASAAVNKLLGNGVKRVTMISLIAAPEGVQVMLKAHPGVKIFAAALDRELNEKGYILPGLGDAGDRYFGA